MKWDRRMTLALRIVASRVQTQKRSPWTTPTPTASDAGITLDIGISETGNRIVSVAAQLYLRMVNLDKLIVLKRAAGRPKDLAVVAELQGILERRKTPG